MLLKSWEDADKMAIHLMGCLSVEETKCSCTNVPIIHPRQNEAYWRVTVRRYSDGATMSRTVPAPDLLEHS